MTWRTLFLDVSSGLFFPRLVLWDPETGEFTLVEGPKGFSPPLVKPGPHPPSRSIIARAELIGS